VPFTVKDIKWVDLTNINAVPPHRIAGSAKGGADNDTLFLYGGHPTNEEMALVYTFDTKSNTWGIPKITGDYQQLNKSALVPAIDDNGKMYLFGGFLYDPFERNNYMHDMTILDTINLKFEQGISTNAPNSRGYYGAVLLPNKKILYVGKKNIVGILFATHSI
jgi:hypothetical protein